MTRLSALCFLALLVLPAAAQARPRDTVMGQAMACGVIGPSRLWLDCYYGAAQAARAALGLPSAPPAQVQLAAAPPPARPAADAETRVAVMGQAFRCDGADRAWLDCYYAAAAPMRSRLGLSVPVQPPVHGLPPDQFGRPPPPVQDLPRNIDRVTSQITTCVFDAHGIFRMTLANGQVWQQLSGDPNTLELRKPATSYSVTITRGLWGSYNLKLGGLRGLYKVQRL